MLSLMCRSMVDGLRLNIYSRNHTWVKTSKYLMIFATISTPSLKPLDAIKPIISQIKVLVSPFTMSLTFRVMSGVAYMQSREYMKKDDDNSQVIIKMSDYIAGKIVLRSDQNVICIIDDFSDMKD